MKVLFSMLPLFGHLHPLVPLARALAEAGHGVAFATAKSFARFVERTGFRVFPAGVDHGGEGVIFASLVKQGLMAPDAAPGPHVFAEILAGPMVADLRSVTARWQPDLILSDPVELGGCLAAELAGIANVSFSWAYHWPKQTMKDWWGKGLAALRAEYGLPHDPEMLAMNRYLTIDYMPAGWATAAYPRPSTAHSFHAPLYDCESDFQLPDWVAGLPAQPTVYATLGTALNHAPEMFRAFVAAFGARPLNLIITVGPGMSPRRFDPLPANIHIETYIPQSLILPHCHAVIAHGGYNTLIAALHHGLPLVLTPLTAKDQPVNAARCRSLGLGIVVEGRPPDPVALAEAVDRVLTLPAYSANALGLQAELKALPPLSEAVRLLERLVGAKTSGAVPGR